MEPLPYDAWGRGEVRPSQIGFSGPRLPESQRSKIIENTLSTARVATEAPLSSLETALTVARIADEFRAQEIVVLDLRNVTPITDYFVIATATSGRQMQALADEVGRTLKGLGQRPLGVEGVEGTTWVLQDYGDVVLHVFNPESRKLYDLERLWADGVRVEWQPAR